MVTKRESPVRGRARLAGAERRALIEGAAARLFAQRGFEATTVEAIVAAAGVSKPMLYRHFDSKKDLVIALMERRRDELAAAPLDEYVRAPAVESLSAMIDAWFVHVEAHPDTCRLLFQDAVGDPDVRAVQEELRRRQRAADVALVAELAPQIPPAEREPLGEVIRSSLCGLALWWLDHPEVPRSTVVEAITRVTRGVFAGA